jgi:hypothetical protein
MARTLLVVALVASAATAQTPGPRIAMEDQFGKPHDVADHKGDVLVLVCTDKAGADAGKALGEKLHIYFHPAAKGQPAEVAQKAPVKPIHDWPAGTKTPDATVVAVACIGEVPGMLKGFVRSKFKSGSPVVPVWLDMTDAMRKAYTVTPGVPNVIVYDKSGATAFVMAGAFDEARFATLVQQIDTLRVKK